MGSAPTIDGGMTEEQYRQLQMEEREFMAQQEERQMMLMSEMEDKRVQREQAEMKRQERMREKEEEALTALEGSISDEIASLGKGDKKEDKDIVMDFYGSLAENTPGSMPTGGGLTASDKAPPELNASGKGRGQSGGFLGGGKTSKGRAGGRPK